MQIRKYCILVIGCSIISYEDIQAQEIDLGSSVGNMLNVDPDFKSVRKKVYSFQIAYSHQLSIDTCGYAKAYGFPGISYGFSVINMNNVRIRSRMNAVPYNSRMGTAFIAYIGFTRPLLHFSRNLSLEYILQHGMAYNTHIWNKASNMENEFVGAKYSFYVDMGLQLEYKHYPWTFKISPEFKHMSNGTLARPNKGANWTDINIAAGFNFQKERKEEPTDTVSYATYSKKLFLELTYGTELKTSLGEWLVDRNLIWAEKSPKYKHYRLYVSHSFSTAIYYRYNLRFATGLGLDFLYEPYLRSIEIQNETPKNLQKTSWGLSLCQHVYYHNLVLSVSLGKDLSRPFRHYARTDEEFGYYERLGFSWILPFASKHFFGGYDILAHKTKAYSTELKLGYRFSLHNKL